MNILRLTKDNFRRSREPCKLPPTSSGGEIILKVYMAIQQCLLDIYFYTILSPSNHKSISGGTNIKDSTDIKVGKKQLIVATNVLQNLLAPFNYPKSSGSFNFSVPDVLLSIFLLKIFATFHFLAQTACFTFGVYNLLIIILLPFLKILASKMKKMQQTCERSTSIQASNSVLSSSLRNIGTFSMFSAAAFI